MFLTFIMASVCYSYAYDIVKGDFSFNILSDDDATVVLAKASAPSKSTEMKIPAILVVGPKDAEEGIVSVRLRDKEEKVKLTKLASYLKAL